MSKYVAFLDILGFKNKLSQLGQIAAERYIGDFSSTAYNEWRRINPHHVEGYIVSDSFIIYTRNATPSALNELLSVIDSICKAEFSKNNILIRGAIAKGEFERMPAVELSSLSKGLIVGQAYVDAYSLEDKSKVAGILLTEEVYADMSELDCHYECTEEKENGTIQYIMRYIDYSFLSKTENMIKYVNLATESNWLPHYYNTLYYALKTEDNSRKVSDFFSQIIASIGEPSEYWRDIDKFIKNAFHSDVISNFQTRFLKYIREQMVSRTNVPIPVINRAGTKERVQRFIEERGNLTISQISSTLGISQPTATRIVRDLTDEGVVTVSTSKVVSDSNATRRVKTYSANRNK